MATDKKLEKAFWMLLSATAMVLAWVGVSISNKIDIMSQSVIELNTTMKTVIYQINENRTKLNNNDYLLNDLENRVLILENKKLGE